MYETHETVILGNTQICFFMQNNIRQTKSLNCESIAHPEQAGFLTCNSFIILLIFIDKIPVMLITVAQQLVICTRFPY